MSKYHTLSAKDLIIAGAFSAFYVVVLFVTVSILGFIPILYLSAPFFLSVVLGPIYMLYLAKIPKKGAILLLSCIVGLVTSLGGMAFAFLWSLFIGLISEFIAYKGKYFSKKYQAFSFIVFSCTNMGPFWGIILTKRAFLEASIRYNGQEYANKIDALTGSWIIVVLLLICLIGGIIGSRLGLKLLYKHFEKAGVAS